MGTHPTASNMTNPRGTQHVTMNLGKRMWVNMWGCSFVPCSPCTHRGHWPKSTMFSMCTAEVPSMRGCAAWKEKGGCQRAGGSRARACTCTCPDPGPPHARSSCLLESS